MKKFLILFMFVFIGMSINQKSDASQIYQLCDELINKHINHTANMTGMYQNGSDISIGIGEICQEVVKNFNVRLIAAPLIETFSQSSDAIAESMKNASWVGSVGIGTLIGGLTVCLLGYQTYKNYQDLELIKKRLLMNQNLSLTKPTASFGDMTMASGETAETSL